MEKRIVGEQRSINSFRQHAVTVGQKYYNAQNKRGSIQRLSCGIQPIKRQFSKAGSRLIAEM